jgi:glucose/arabinose dehydrogenase
MKSTLLLCLLLGAPSLPAQTKRTALPPPNPAGNVSNGPKVIPRPDGQQLRLPAGFRAEPYATGFQKPRYLLQLRGGQVLVSDSVAKGAVYVVTRGQEKRALIEGLDRPFGMAVWKGYLYVSEAEAIKRFKLDEKTVSVGAPEVVVPLKGYGKGHWTRSIAFDKRTGRMFVSLGSSSNVEADDPEDRAAINTYNPDGTDHQILAKGLRNPVSIRFHPVTNELWTTVQERDGLGDDLVPDFLTHVEPGAFYGWPYAYIGSNEEPRRKGENPALVAKSIEPDVLLPPHVAVMDFLFYTGKQFPAKYRNGAFLAYRGSSNRAKRVGYSIAFVPFQGGKPSGPQQEFAGGWMLGEDRKEVWGRPVGVLQLADGSLLVSEDANNTLWRISYSK